MAWYESRKFFLNLQGDFKEIVCRGKIRLTLYYSRSLRFYEIKALEIFAGVRTSLSHDVSLVGSHSPGWAQFRQFEGGERSVAAHRAPRILSREYQLIGAG